MDRLHVVGDRNDVAAWAASIFPLTVSVRESSARYELIGTKSVRGRSGEGVPGHHQFALA